MNTFGNLIVNFFRNYLSKQKGYSPNTIASYSDCIKLLLAYCCKLLTLSFDKLDLDMINDELILNFLDHLEQERANKANSRNQRLAVIKTFYRFLASQDPTLTELCEKICAISVKKTEHKTINPLQEHEMDAIFDAVDMNTSQALRDNALLLCLHHTGARVQELVDLNLDHLNLEVPRQVIITGKGKKQRIVPLLKETVDAIKSYIEFRQKQNIKNEALFLNAKGMRITRFGILYTIQKYAKIAAQSCSSLKNKTVTPHIFRHTNALNLIQAGVDISVAKELLGHTDIKTTSLYVNIDLDMKRKALEKCTPSFLNNNKNCKPKWKNDTVDTFLQNLSKMKT